MFPEGGSRMKIKLLLVYLLLVAAARGAEPARIIDQLWTHGLTLDQGVAVQLTQPTLPDGLDAAAQQRAVEGVADETHPLDALMRHSIVAPFVLKIADEKPVRDALPRRVDLWFFAYGDLQKITDESFLKGMIEGDSKGNAGGLLTDQELQQRGLTPGKDERYAAGTVSLFDRVRISGVMRMQLTRTDDSALVAGVLDPRFERDATHPNSWSPITRDEDGKLQVGQPRVYHAVGWYCKVTRLAAPAGALFVEYHLLFDEPHGWFNGANLLRSKLPILAQDGVRKLRRRLEGQASE
jgi:hypothetical protein